ncbi:conserved hypothetical protein [Actinopolymorpha cephalotaxi]|uniref:Uncharacterized protein (TIGR02246 family) n=1 Tax=Actinopolymorpha cephalotaxi TaxID=504797 RepID=A0A1I2YJQ9_9ACTN|nr:SgcJ/EcaC family oxidoreductase [Actinopolymorpha cephalotaxi]NYH86937.1 uncharacterized protein (TIGR02246 family) [Actinopolymorpha cephalotaxi]SFH25767.1 conserved hypothetical protein [Actinopolymorpha cephalotaxi]
MRTRTIRLAVIAGSTRPFRRAHSVADWVCAAASEPGQDRAYDLTLVDLAEVDLPMLSEPAPAMVGQYAQETTRRWSELVGRFDGYVLVSPEYNHSTSAVLKNALDHLYAEWRDKPVGFVGYGTDGGVRAVEHLRLVAAELGMAGVGPQVALNLFDDFDGQSCAPRTRQVEARDRMLAGVARWAEALRPLRPARSAPVPDGDRPILADPAAYPAATDAVEQFVTALQGGVDSSDADRFDHLFAADVMWGSPYGRTLAGFTELNAIHRTLMARQAAPPSRFEIVRVTAPAPDVAVAHVRRQAVDADGKATDGFSEMAMYVLVERDRRWWLAGGQNTPIAQAQPLPS